MINKNRKQGIYKITSIVDGKVYIGQSVHIIKRWGCHRSNMKLNKHCNKHLQATYNLYGPDNFKFDIIECCPPEEIDAKEIYWINHYQSTDDKHGYNFEGGGNLNKVMAESTKKKISIHKKAEVRLPCSEETKKKISVANMGNTAWLGKTHTEESKRKMREIKKFKPPQEMIDDIKSGVSMQEFLDKYRTTDFRAQRTWNNLRKELNIKHRTASSKESYVKAGNSSRGQKRTPEQIERIKEGMRKSKENKKGGK